MDARRSLNTGLDAHFSATPSRILKADAGVEESGGTSEYLWRIRSFAQLEPNVYYRVSVQRGLISKYETHCIAQLARIDPDPKRGKIARFRVSHPGTMNLRVGNMLSIDEKQDVEEGWVYMERGPKKS